jgi:uncharacterized membrane protein
MMMNKQSSILETIAAAVIIGTILALSVAVLITQEAGAAASHITTDKLLDKALRSITWPNHVGYSYDPEQEKIMYEPWTLISR